MLALSPSATIYFCTKPTDMRKGFDGLLALIKDHLHQDPFAGGLYAFVNRRKDRLKLLAWEGDGLAIYYRRLEQGSYQCPAADGSKPSVVLSATDLSLILSGIDLKSVKRRKRYQQAKTREAETKR
jgi:transposase